MTNQKKNFLTLGLLILLVVLFSIYIYKDLRKTTNPSLTQPQNNSQNSPVSAETTEPGQNYKISLISDENGPKIPNLALPVVNSGYVGDTVFEVVAKNIGILAEKLKKDPKNESNWLQLATLRKMLADYQISAGILNYVGVLWPNDYVPANNLADLYQFYLKNYPLAEKNWLKVIALKPDYIQAYENLYNLYADPSYKEKQDQALPILLKGLANNTKNIDLMVYIARYYRGTGNKDLALNYYAKALNEAHAENHQQLEASLHSEAAEMNGSN